MLKRRASAVWQGGLQGGTGSLSATSGVLNDTPYSFKTRLVSEDGQAGTNPEELLAAAHAGCYAMALGATLERNGHVADKLEVQAILTLDTDTLTVTAVTLNLDGSVPGISDEQFQTFADDAKKNCIISRALSPGIQISLNAKLV